MIDTNPTAGVTELDAVKTRLGADMVLQGRFSYSNFSGELGKQSKPQHSNLGINDIFLYGNTDISIIYTVQVFGCPGKKEFIFDLGNLKDFFILPTTTTFISSSPKKWADENRGAFLDFIKASEFPQCLESLENRIKSSIGLNYYQIANGFGSGTGSDQTCGLRSLPLGIGTIRLFDLSPNCSKLYEVNAMRPRRSGISVPTGKSCQFAFGIYKGGTPSEYMLPTYDIVLANARPLIERAPVEGPIVLFPQFTVNGKPGLVKTSITCVKGKDIRKINAVNPKCPVGFKKK